MYSHAFLSIDAHSITMSERINISLDKDVLIELDNKLDQKPRRYRTRSEIIEMLLVEAIDNKSHWINKG